MSEFPSLPLFTDAYMADTRHLTAQEHGAYLLLLMMAWRSPDCRIPDDDDKLARWASVDARTWKRIKPTIMDFWTPESGTWVQKRLAKEREYVSKRADVARENGKQGGRPKALKHNGSDNPAGSSRVTQTKAPNPSPNPIEAKQQRASEFLYDKLIEAASSRGGCHPNLAMGIGPITDLTAKGYDLDADILPVIREKARPDIASWKFYATIIVERVASKNAIPQKPSAPVEDWSGRIAAWNQDRTWIHAWGPKPGERGCRVPRDLLERIAA